MADNGALLAHLGSRDGLGACRGKERCAARGGATGKSGNAVQMAGKQRRRWTWGAQWTVSRCLPGAPPRGGNRS